jgi:hypothetical protein
VNARFVRACARAYRRIARAFPGRFRTVCGDGLEQLGIDVMPLVWREFGVPGIARMFVDLLVRLPIEYAAAWTGRLKELTMNGDRFEGTWKAVNEKSRWDPKYTPEQACMRFEPTDEGYVLVAYGIRNGQAVAERPTRIFADGRKRPLVDFGGRPIPGVPAGALSFGRRTDDYTLEAGAEVDGKSLSSGTFKVSPDGQTMTVTTEGMGPEGPFKVAAVFERVTPDPYAPA